MMQVCPPPLGSGLQLFGSIVQVLGHATDPVEHGAPPSSALPDEANSIVAVKTASTPYNFMVISSRLVRYRAHPGRASSNEVATFTRPKIGKRAALVRPARMCETGGGIVKSRHSKATTGTSCEVPVVFCCVERVAERAAQYMPPMPGPPAGAAGLSSFFSTMSASVVRSRPAIEAEFWSAVRVTLVGSITPACTRSSYVSVRAL